MIAEVVICRLTSFLPTSAPRSLTLNREAVDNGDRHSAHITWRGHDAPHCSHQRSGSDGAPHCREGSSRGSPQIIGKGHRKQSASTLLLTREATQAHVTCRGRAAPQCSHQHSEGGAA